MKIAKASKNDLDVAIEMCVALGSLTGWAPTVPTSVEVLNEGDDSEPFNRDDREQCVRVLGYLLDLSDRASLMRVVWGCSVMLDPRNKCVNPESDVIEHHPETLDGIAAKTPKPLAEWTKEVGPVLWWRFPVSDRPWVGTPDDPAWDASRTHWTPIVTPTQPTLTADIASFTPETAEAD